MSNKNDNIDKITELTPELMQQYMQGKLSHVEQHAVEKYLLNNPFEADALEGIMNYSENFESDIDSLKTRISEKLEEEKDIKIIPIWKQYYTVAAAVVVVVLSSVVLFTLFNEDELMKDKMALQEKIAQPDSTTKYKEKVLTEQNADEFNKEEAIVKDTDNRVKKEELVTKDNELVTKASSEPEIQGQENPAIESNNLALQITEEIQEGESTITMADMDEQKLEYQSGEDKAVEKEINAAELDLEESEVVAQQEVDGVLRDRASDLVMNKSARKKSAKPEAKAATIIHQEQPSSNEKIITGKITSIEDGSPLPGVNVVVKGTTSGTITDIDGEYEITVDKNDELQISFIGYATEEIEVGDRNSINLALASDVQQLSEVVVTGYGEGNKTVEYKNVRPADGYRAYRTYLKDSLKYPQQALDSAVKGKVVIEFTVLKNGSITNLNIKKSLGYGCDEEAIRLIKEGPAWQPAEEKGQSVEKKVRVKVKFE